MNRRQPVRFKPTPAPAAQARPDPVEQDDVYAVKRRPGERLEQIARVSQAAKSYCGGAAEPAVLPACRSATHCAGCRCSRLSKAVLAQEDSADDDDELDEILRGLSRSKTRAR